ncbi:MAG: PQQ-binding-like beta-propeller repeat protein [Phycisphaerae bacterium]|nr:PQQ-binding-like beta-propeller repeat protein [Phycisphaerae bacterium]
MYDRVVFKAFVLSFLLTITAHAEDWAHWRGPELNGSSGEVNLPDTWGKTKNIAWSAPLPGHSSATPIISQGKVFISSTGHRGKSLQALCFDEKTGKELWRKTIGKTDRKLPQNDLTTPSPVADGKVICFLYGNGVMVGLDYSGEKLWSRNLEKDYGDFSIKFGYSSSLSIYEGKLYVQVLRSSTPYDKSRVDKSRDSYLLAADPKTGETLFRHIRSTDAVDESSDGYSTPIFYEHNGRKEILVIGADYITGHDPQTGKEFWRYGYANKKSNIWRHIPTLLTADNLIIGIRPRTNTGMIAIKAGGRGKLTDDAVAWEFNGPTPDCPSPCYYKGNIYVLCGGRGDKVLSCLDAKTGKLKWSGDLGGRAPWRASLTAADDKIYCINEDGQAVVLAAGDKEFKILSRIDMGEKPIQASIAIANGHLFVRTTKTLYCVGGK